MKKNHENKWTDVLVIRRYESLITLFTGFSLGLVIVHPIFFVIFFIFALLIFTNKGLVSSEDFKKMLTSKGYIKIKRRKK